jgi:hypothetical protein
MWRNLNIIVEKKRLGMFIFKGFMADNAQENWNVVHIVYVIGNPMVKMIDKNRMCFSH